MHIRPILLVIAMSFSLQTFSQRPPEAFFQGLDSIFVNPAKSKELFFQAVREDSTFHGSYNFLGILYDYDNNYDSAISFLQTAIRLNTNNANHTKEASIERLCKVYMHHADFERGYNTALNGLKEFPDNIYLQNTLKDICLWAYHTKYGGLSLTYLQPEPLPVYAVNSVNQEYLVMRSVTVDHHALQFLGQSYISSNNTDVLKCLVTGTKDTINLVFKLGWDISNMFGDNMPDYKIVYEDKSLAIWYRAGAILSNNPKTDLLEEIEKLGK